MTAQRKRKGPSNTYVASGSGRTQSACWPGAGARGAVALWAGRKSDTAAQWPPPPGWRAVDGRW